MKEIELFYLTHCPYCVKARKAVDELMEENPAFAGLSVKWIEENEEPELAGSRDYYCVPSLFFAGKKLYEASPADDYNAIKGNIRSAFTAALRHKNKTGKARALLPGLFRVFYSLFRPLSGTRPWCWRWSWWSSAARSGRPGSRCCRSSYTGCGR